MKISTFKGINSNRSYRLALKATKTTIYKLRKTHENPSVKKQEFKDKSVELTATFAPKSKHQIKKISRSIPSHLRKYVWKRDGRQCTYVHH